MRRDTYLRAALVAVCVFAHRGGACAETADPDPTRFEAEIDSFESWDRQNSFPRNAVLFVGSSSIRMWQTAECFPKLSIINRGFGGSHISDVNYFVDRIVLKYEPQTIVFYAGDNDIAAGKSPRQVADDFQSFVKLIGSRLPRTRILFLPIKPSINRWKLWPKMEEANLLVQKLAQGNDHLLYVDTATPMLNSDSRPRPELFLNDGLHMSAKGYEVWTGVLSTLLRE